MRFKKIFTKFPFLYKQLRRIYLYTIYIIKGNFNFRIYTSPSISIKSIDDFCENNLKVKSKFFGYYDKTPWSKSGEFYLFHVLNSNGSLSINFLDSKEKKCFEIGKTYTWNYQQGAMLQWCPIHQNLVIYNTVKDNILGSIIFNIRSGENHFIEWPVQSVHPKGDTIACLNYSRLLKVNREYGYVGKFKNFSSELSYSKDGLWIFNLLNNTSKLLFSLDDLLKYKPKASMKGGEHCINHVMFSHSGSKLIFLHRWVTKDNNRVSRLYVINDNGSDLKLLLDNDFISHYCWMNDKDILTYSETEETGKKYYIINTINGSIKLFGNESINQFGDGHPNISPNGNWIVTDNYPDSTRIRRLLLWDIRKKELHMIGKFYSPVSFEDDKRCDLHPRWHPLKPLISIDSAHEGRRKNYVINVENLTGSFLDE